MVTFRKNDEERIGAKLTCADLEEVSIPEYALYTDEDQNKIILPDLDEEVTSEVGDEHVHVSVMLLCVSQMMYGTIKARKWDLDGKPIGCLSDNPILDTCLYDVEFLDGGVMLLSANMIAQAMYAQYDIDGSEYFLLECFLDIQKYPCIVLPYVGTYIVIGKIVPCHGKSCQTWKQHTPYRLLSAL